MEHYSYEWIVIYFLGGLTVFFLFNRKILRPSAKDEKPADKYYNLIASSIDLSVYNDAINAIELERERIGSDLHDEMSPYISSIYIDLQVVSRENLVLSIEASRMLDEMRYKIKYTVEALRRVIFAILPVALENQDLDNAIRELCQKFDGVKGTHVLFRREGIAFVLNDQQKLYLYRIVQELINNCFKHSQAWNVFVSLTWDVSKLKIIVKDNGIGMAEYVGSMGHYGMTGIFIRSKILGANVRFIKPDQGVEFELILMRSDNMK